MDAFLRPKKIQSGIKTRWDRIEARHYNSAASLFDRPDSTIKAICNELIENREYITNTQLKAMSGEKLKQWHLDPNLVMDLRHSKPRHKSAHLASRRRVKSFNKYDRLHFKKMHELNHEIDKFKKSLENIRPKGVESKCNEIVKPTYLIHSFDDFKFDHLSNHINDDGIDAADNCIIASPRCIASEMNESEDETVKLNSCCELILMNEPESNKIEAGNEQENICKTLVPISISSECLPDESPTTNEFNMHSFMSEPYEFSESETLSQNQLQTMIRQQPQIQHTNDDFEFIIKPSILVNIQDTLRSNCPNDNDNEHRGKRSKPTEFQCESKIEVNQQMSIFIKKLTNETERQHQNMYLGMEQVEGNQIINQMLERKLPNDQTDFILLQKCFLQWVHFTTIEKLKRRNPAQSRLQKMEAFLQNIQLERKRALNKLRRPGNTTMLKRDSNYKTVSFLESNMEPRLQIRTFTNKLKTQQDIIELQKIKLERQQRVITELKLSKLLDDTNEAECHLRDELRMVAKKGCANSRSKAKCLQIAGNLREKTDETDAGIQAKGTTAPKFLIEMQARAMERQLRHEEAQRRREAIEREKETMRLAAEEERRQLDEETKRQRIKEYWRKRREEKELEQKKALDRLKFLADLEKAKAFNRDRVQKCVLDKFRNIVKWRTRNERVSREMYRRNVIKYFFKYWKTYTARVCAERLEKATAFSNRLCLKFAWALWQEKCLITQSKKMVADDWYHLRLSIRVFEAWERQTAKSRLIAEIKQKQAEAHFNWYMKWKVLEHWRRLHAILKIEKDTEARRERWRNKVYELIPDYKPNTEFI